MGHRHGWRRTHVWMERHLPMVRQVCGIVFHHGHLHRAHHQILLLPNGCAMLHITVPATVVTVNAALGILIVTIPRLTT
jgi:hypothetical protein